MHPSYWLHNVSALLDAVKRNNVHAVTGFVELSEDVNKVGDRRVNLLLRAARSPDIAEILLAAGAAADVPVYWGLTIAHYAAAEWLGLEVLRMLADRGANLDQTDRAGKRPIDIARENRQYMNVRFLESHLHRRQSP